MVNQENIAKNVSHGEKGWGFKNNQRWGWYRFIKRDHLTDIRKGFIKDDTIIIEASLNIYAKQTTTMTK